MKLLDYKYKVAGWILLFAAIPLSVFSLYIVRAYATGVGQPDEVWTNIIFNYPITVGLCLITFSKTKNENETTKSNRMKAITTAVEVFIWFGLIFSILYAGFKTWMIEHTPSGFYFGGLLGSVNVLLILINLYFFVFQRNAKKEN